MANEITINGSIAYSDSEDTDLGPLSIVDLLKTASTKKAAWLKQNIGTSEAALNLAGITAPGYVIIVNRDTTNYVDVKVATSGAIFARLDPNNGFCIVKLGSGSQAPYLIANTAACQVEYLLCST